MAVMSSASMVNAIRHRAVRTVTLGRPYHSWLPWPQQVRMLPPLMAWTSGPLPVRRNSAVRLQPVSVTAVRMGAGVRMWAAKCNSEEKALGKAKEDKLTVSVGEFCSKKVLGVCLQKKRSYCQFDSKLAQIVQQQGRNGQLRIGFGSSKHPDCRGITVDELQRIKFDQLDFTNFYEDLMKNQQIPDNGALTEKVKEQIAGQLKQVGK